MAFASSALAESSATPAPKTSATPASTPAGAGDLAFATHGKALKTLTRPEAERLAPPQVVTVHESHEGVERAYRALPVRALLDAVYGDAWRKSEEILFTCSDGYQPSIPTAKFLQYDAYLAVSRVDQPEFTLINKLQNNELVQLGPFYLIWDNLKHADLRPDGASDHPYQVVGLDLISFAEKFPGMGPPSNASAAAKRGFLHFRKHCLSCHTVNGEGGAKSIELNYPVSVTEYIRIPFLKRWIADPPSIRHGAMMPPLSEGLAERQKVIDDIIAYLTAMAQRKIAPK